MPRAISRVNPKKANSRVSPQKASKANPKANRKRVLARAKPWGSRGPGQEKGAMQNSQDAVAKCGRFQANRVKFYKFLHKIKYKEGRQLHATVVQVECVEKWSGRSV